MPDSHAMQHGNRGKSDRKSAGLSNSVRRALAILGLLNKSPRPLSFSDIKVELGLPKSTTSLLLYTLESLGYLTRDEEGRRYWLNPHLYAPGFAPMSHPELTEIAEPVLKALSSTLALTSFIAVLDSDQVLFLMKADGPRAAPCDIYAGRKASAQCTAVGKVLLAWMDDEEQQKFLARHPVMPHTSRTITSKDALLKELKRVRRFGYAIDDREEALSIRCVAVPVITGESPGTTALGITGRVSEIRPDNIASLVAYMKKMARQITRGESDAPFGGEITSELAAK